MDALSEQKISEINSLSMTEIESRMDMMRKTLLTLEWDKKMNQINSGMESRLLSLRQEWSAMEGRYKSLSTEPTK